MIIIDKIEIKTTNKNVGHYIKLGYNIKSGDSIIIDVYDLPKTSKHKIDVSCDMCKIEYKISYFSYLRNTRNDNIYYCKKCSGIRAKETNLEKYGVEHPLKLKKFKDKSKITNIEKYGVEYSIQNKDIKNKAKKTIQERYGSDEYMTTDDVKKKSKKTNLDKYGVEYPLQNELIKIKKQSNPRYVEKVSFNKRNNLDYKGNPKK